MSRVIKPTDNFRPGVEVRLVNFDNEQLGIVTIETALDKAEEAGLDLVLVAEKGNPPVCRLMDFKKRQYEAKKAQREAKKKQHAQKVKEVKFHVNVDKHDYDYKIKRAIQFLEKGHKVKFSLFLRGREMGFKDKAMDVMRQVAEDIKEHGTLENQPKFVNRSINMVVGALSKKK